MARFAFIVTAITCLLAAATASAVDAGGRAPEIGLEDLGGHRITVAGLRGQVFVLDIWGSWCPPCREEMPMLQALYAELRDQGFTVIAVSEDRDRTTIDPIVRRFALTFPIVHDRQQVVPTRYGATQQPTSYVVDRQGIVQHVHRGYAASDADAIRAEVRELVTAPR